LAGKASLREKRKTDLTLEIGHLTFVI